MPALYSAKEPVEDKKHYKTSTIIPSKSVYKVSCM